MKIFRFPFPLLVLLLCLIGIAAWLLIFRNNGLLSAAELGGSPPTPSPGSPASHVDMTRDDPMAAFIKAFNTPIELHGKVVDQHGDPVAGATVKLSPVDRPFGDQSNSHVTVISDMDGKFSLKKAKGFSVGARATKDGYMTLPPLGGPSSQAMVSYADGAEHGKRVSNPATPLVLTLHKIGPVEPMFYMKDTCWNLPYDGTLVSIALDSEKGLGDHQIKFRFKSGWFQLPRNNEIYGKRYDWSLEASIPGGGFVESDTDYQFEAPEEGYRESIKIEYLATRPEKQWKQTGGGRYFVRFHDGSYGRLRFNIEGSSVQLYMTSWLNLKPGSRNLSSTDWDPTRVSE